MQRRAATRGLRRLGVGSLGASLLVVVACSGRPTVTGGMNDSEWSRHCQLVVKREVECSLLDEEEAEAKVALCRKTQECALAAQPIEMTSALFSCQERDDCNVDCQEKAAELAKPTAEQTRAEALCRAKFPDCYACGSGKSGAKASAWEAIGQCFEHEASSCDEANMCHLKGLTVLGDALACLVKNAPEEMAAGLQEGKRRPLKERAKTDSFGEGFETKLGEALPPVPPQPSVAPPRKTAKGGRQRPRARTVAPPALPTPPVKSSWDYGDLVFDVQYDSKDGRVEAIRFSAPSATEEQCQAFVARLIADYGRPSRMIGSGSRTRIWRGSTSILEIFGFRDLGGGCRGAYSAKGSRTWQIWVDPE